MKRGQWYAASTFFAAAAAVFFWGAMTQFTAVTWVVYGSFGVAMLTFTAVSGFMGLSERPEKKRRR